MKKLLISLLLLTSSLYGIASYADLSPIDCIQRIKASSVSRDMVLIHIDLLNTYIIAKYTGLDDRRWLVKRRQTMVFVKKNFNESLRSLNFLCSFKGDQQQLAPITKYIATFPR